MDYDAIDRDMSCWVVTTTRLGTRFYISDNEAETATDILANAKRYRWPDQAEAAAKRATKDFGWAWESITVPSAQQFAAVAREEREAIMRLVKEGAHESEG